MMFANCANAPRVSAGGVTTRGSSAASAVVATTMLSARRRTTRAGISTEFLPAKRVGDLELLEVEARVGPETEFAEQSLLQFDEQRFVLGTEAIEDFRMDVDAQVRLLGMAL